MDQAAQIMIVQGTPLRLAATVITLTEPSVINRQCQK